MKLVTFEVQTVLGTRRRIGAVLDPELTETARIVDLNLAYATLLAESGESRAYEVASALMPPDMLAYLEGGPTSHQRARDVLRFMAENPGRSGPQGEQLIFRRNEVKLLSPVPRPLSIRDFSTYEEHMSTTGLQKGGAFYTFPAAYKGNPGAVRGPDDPMLFPAYSDFLDPELELAFFVYKRGRNIRIEEGMDYVGGYTIFVDCSARDMFERDWLGQYKQKDFCTMVGPCLVTPDAFNEYDARCGIRVNGETWFEGNVAQRRHFFSPELVAYASDGEDLYPGDLIAGGTIGFGCSMDLKKWVKPGDIVEHWIEGIGTMKAVVVKEENPYSYVRNGLPGRLPLPEHLQGYLDQVRRRQEQAVKEGNPWYGR